MFLYWFALILNVAADNPYSGQPIQHTEPACCTSKTVGGLLYSLTSQDDNAEFACLNSCRYARENEEGENMYCFAAGPLKVECHDRGTEPVRGTKEPITEQPGTKGTKSALLVATGVTGTSEVINSVEILMEGRDGMYTSRQVLKSGECSGVPNFPVATASAPGAVFNDLAQICVGYKTPPASPQCFKFNTNAAWENDFNLEKPLTRWGSSVVLNNSWWIIGREPDGVKTELWGGNPPFFLRNIELPLQMNQPCMAKISEHEAFVTAIPTSIAVTSNLAWIFNILTGIWTPLPNTKEERSGTACGVLKTSSGRFVVLAGGYKSSTTEIYNLDAGTTGAWTMGPSIGVDVSGGSMVSVKNETELLLVGGYSTTALSDIRRMNESMSSWVPVGILTTPRFGAVALAVPLGDLPPVC